MSEPQTIGENAYFINTSDPRINKAELARLNDQDIMLNEIMSLFPRDRDGREIYAPKPGDAILDVACGPANWIREAYAAYPAANYLGIDNNLPILEYARQNEATRNAENVKFCAVDITQKTFEYLDPTTGEKNPLPDDTFNFVNVRFVSGILLANQWSDFVQECYRVCAPGGFIRLTEADSGCVAGAPNHHWLNKTFVDAMWKAGRSFSEYEWAVTPMLGKFMSDVGCVDLQEEAFALNYSTGRQWHELQKQNFKMSLQFMQPFLVSQGIPEEQFQKIFTGMFAEFESDFYGLWYILSEIGQKPAA
jgi:ubiquinone/menaquinone biosynthesis C-methylase UbiE